MTKATDNQGNTTQNIINPNVSFIQIAGMIIFSIGIIYMLTSLNFFHAFSSGFIGSIVKIDFLFFKEILIAFGTMVCVLAVDGISISFFEIAVVNLLLVIYKKTNKSKYDQAWKFINDKKDPGEKHLLNQLYSTPGFFFYILPIAMFVFTATLSLNNREFLAEMTFGNGVTSEDVGKLIDKYTKEETSVVGDYDKEIKEAKRSKRQRVKKVEEEYQAALNTAIYAQGRKIGEMYKKHDPWVMTDGKFRTYRKNIEKVNVKYQKLLEKEKNLTSTLLAQRDKAAKEYKENNNARFIAFQDFAKDEKLALSEKKQDFGWMVGFVEVILGILAFCLALGSAHKQISTGHFALPNNMLQGFIAGMTYFSEYINSIFNGLILRREHLIVLGGATAGAPHSATYQTGVAQRSTTNPYPTSPPSQTRATSVKYVDLKAPIDAYRQRVKRAYKSGNKDLMRRHLSDQSQGGAYFKSLGFISMYDETTGRIGVFENDNGKAEQFRRDNPNAKSF